MHTSAPQGRLRLLAFAMASAAALLVTPASAAIVTYTLSGQLDGSVGSTALANTPFVWTVTANNLAPTSVSGLPALQALSADVRIGGVGDAVFATPSYVLQSTDLNEFAFVDKTVTNGVGWTSPNFAQALGDGAIAAQPVTFGAAVGAFQTSLGAFDLTQASGLTFSATVAPSPPAVYTLSGVISGALNGVAFANDPFRWTVTGDTTALASYMGLPALQGLASSLHLDGFGDLATGSFVVGLSTDNSEAGFIDPRAGQGIAVSAPLFSTYTLGQSLAGLPVSFAGAVGVATSGGLLQIDSADGLTLSAAPQGAVPEPSSWTLAIVGFATLGAALRTRRTRRAVAYRPGAG